jgi:formylglycine-generating enzyme required for sulfatase activity
MKNKMQTVAVKGGEFTMGSDLFGPIRGVKLDSFRIGKYPVTNAQYNEIMGEHKGLFSVPDYPVERVSWTDAVKFCNKLSEKEGLDKCYTVTKNSVKCDFKKNGYRLPTEAEWEYAAKGGAKSTGFDHSGSKDPNEVGWYENNSEMQLHPVGSKKPNELKIYDMSGSVFEWCWDIYEPFKEETKVLDKPTGPSKEGFRVIRGGSFMRGSHYALVAARISHPGIGANAWLGFRVVRKG